MKFLGMTWEIEIWSIGYNPKIGLLRWNKNINVKTQNEKSENQPTFLKFPLKTTCFTKQLLFHNNFIIIFQISALMKFSMQFFIQI